MILHANYVGRLGRRLLADADAAQVLNFPDNISGQNLSQAFAGLTAQQRANPSATAFTAEPWFENIVGNYFGDCTAASAVPPNSGLPPAANCTTLVADYIGQLGYRGDIGDSIYEMYGDGLLPPNVGMPAQFGAQAYLTNKGSSNYHALLFYVKQEPVAGPEV